MSKLLAALAAIPFSAMSAENIYLLQRTSGPGSGLNAIGSVPGARKLALPESGGHVLALTARGRVMAWGDNRAGQLGSSQLEVRTEWAEIVGLSGITAIGAGSAHSAALKSDGTVWVAGWGRSAAAPVPGLWDVLRIAAGDDFVLALRADGTVWSFGKSLLPEQVTGLWGATAIAAKGPARYGSDVSGRIWQWREAGLMQDVSPADPDAAVAQELLRETASPATWRGYTLGAGPGELRVGAESFSFSGVAKEVAAGWAVALLASEEKDASTAPADDEKHAADPAESAKSATAADFLGHRFLSSSPLITAYDKHSLYVQAGKACAFGENSEGQLGDGTATDRNSPVPTAFLSSLVSISTSQYHSAAVTSGGALYTWGWNGSGRLGDGTTLQHVTPFPVSGFTGAVAVATGTSHTVVLKNDGTVWTFGSNGHGQLGDGSFTERRSPVQVINLSNVIAVSAGQSYSIALKSDGTVWGWGANTWGNLGDGTTTSKQSPVQATALSGVTAIASGYYHTLVLKNDGTLWGFGYNGYGALGDGSTTSRSTAVRAGTLTGVVSMGAGEYHSLAVLNDGTVRSFGLNGDGQLGDGSVVTRLSPVVVSGLSGVARVVGGSNHSIAAQSDGTIWAWGDNSSFQLGRGITGNFTTPTESLACATDPADGTGPAISTAGRFISARETHSLGLRPDGTAVGFGENSEGELGDGTTTDRNTPVAVSGLTGATSISAGYYHGAASTSGGNARAWGWNGSGRLGDGTTVAKLAPVTAAGLTGVQSVATGLHHTLALKTDGTVWAFGENGSGQLGDGSTTARATAVQVIGLTGVTAIAAGQNFSIALKSDGTVWGWGSNAWGNLGDGTITNRTSPVQAIGLSGATAIAAGYYHTLVLRNNGTVWGVGYNGYGALGDGETASRYHITRMGRLIDIVTIGAGEYHSLAVRSNGTVWAAGLNNVGQLGDGSVVNRVFPVQSGSILNPIIAVTGGSLHSLGLRSDGCVMVWGANNLGQFGVATPSASTVPIQGPCNIGIPSSAPPPTISSISPNSAMAGSAAFSLDVTGANFTSQSVVQWNGAARSTVLLNATTLRAQIPATDIASAGAAFVGVADGAKNSNLLTFTVQPNIVIGTATFPVPASNATGVATTASMSWTLASGAASYDVYFGTASPPPFVANVTGPIYNHGPLTPGVTYYWKVIGRNGVSSGPDPGSWNFTVTGTITGYRFIPVAPCRLADTRIGQGFTGSFGPPTLNGGDIRNLPVPSGVCGIPVTAKAYSFNVTVVPAEPLSYLTMWPTGQTQPLVSTLNSFHGGIVANAAIVPAGTAGGVSVYVTNRADVIVDINGYFDDSLTLTSYSFYAVDPCRVADTRAGAGFIGLFGPPTPTAGSTRSFPLVSSGCGLPAAAAYSLNVTVVPPAPLAYLTIFPTGSPQPLVSTLNSFDGAIVANAAIVPAGSNGSVSTFVTHVTDIILDVNGYFGPPGGANELRFEPVTPCRVADTRIAGQGAPIMNAGTTKDFPVAGLCGVPANARAYSLNVTVVPTGGLSYLTLWPTGKTRPLVSTLNSFLGRVVANAALAPAGTNGNVSVFVTDQTHVIVDINGYFR